MGDGAQSAVRAWRPASPKNLDEKRRGPLDHLGLVGEVGVSVDEAAEPDYLAHPVQVAAAGVLEMRDKVEGAKARRLLPLLDGDVDAHLAGGPKLAVSDIDLTRQEDQLAAHGVRHVGGYRRRSLRQLDTQLGKARVDFSGHDFSLLKLLGMVDFGGPID